MGEEEEKKNPSKELSPCTQVFSPSSNLRANLQTHAHAPAEERFYLIFYFLLCLSYLLFLKAKRKAGIDMIKTKQSETSTYVL